MDYAKWANREIDRIMEPRARGATVEALAKRLGMTKNHLHVYLRGDQKFSTKQIEACAEFFGVESPTRSKPANGHDKPAENNVIRFRSEQVAHIATDWVQYPVLGIVDAGAFREADLMSQVEARFHPGPRDPSHPNARPMAWEARGDSMNEAKIFDGTILMGVDFQEAGGVLANNDIVVVEQNRGGLIERSVKAVARFADRIEFQPRSTNPAHKPIIYKNGDEPDGVEVRVLSIIHGTYHPVRT